VGVVDEPVLSRVGAVFELSADAQAFVSPFAREGRAKGSGIGGASPLKPPEDIWANVKGDGAAGLR